MKSLPFGAGALRVTTGHKVAIGAVALYVAALVFIHLWPNYNSVPRLVAATTSVSVGGAVIFALTFWRKARIQIGRRGLKFMMVRRTAAIFAVVAAAPLFVRLTADSRLSAANERTNQTTAPLVKLIVGIPHFADDPAFRLEDALTHELQELAATLPIEVRKIDQVAAPQHPRSAPDYFEHDRVIDYLNHASPRPASGPEIKVIFWGSVEGVGDHSVAHLYESSEVEGMQFGGTFKPRDFALPRLTRNEVVPVVRLIIAAQVANLRITSRQQALKALGPALQPVKRLAMTNSMPSDRDAAGRLNYILAAAMETQGYLRWDEAILRDSLYYYLCAFDDWKSPNAAAERMMTMRATASNVNLLGVMHHDNREREGAIKLLRTTVAKYQGPPDARDLGNIQLLLGDLLADLGTDGQKAKFAEAIGAYDAALKAFPRDQVPQTWAEIEYHVAGLQLEVAEQEPGAQRLTDAVRILNEVLAIWTRDESPFQWAYAQVRLGEVLDTLGDRDPGGGYKLQAIAAEKSALNVITPDADPVAWGRAQTLLGAALSGLGEGEGAAGRLAEAITALRAGATNELREQAAVAWLQAQLALTTALQTLGQIEWREEASAGRRGWQQLDRQADEHLEESVAAARAGLAEATEERYRGLRAYLQSEEAGALEAIGEREAASGNSDATYHLTAAVQAASAALQVLTITSAPENWADTEITLGHALEDLGEHQSNPADFQASVAALEAAEKVETQERDTENWAAIQSALGRAFEKWAMLEKGGAAIQHLERALEHDQASLKPKSPDRDLDEWLTDQENLARTEAELGRLELDTDSKHLKQAAQDYRDELKYLDPDGSPEQWKMASDELNQVLALLRARGEVG